MPYVESPFATVDYDFARRWAAIRNREDQSLKLRDLAAMALPALKPHSGLGRAFAQAMNMAADALTLANAYDAERDGREATVPDFLRGSDPTSADFGYAIGLISLAAKLADAIRAEV